MEDIKRTTLCQCTKCNSVTEYKGGFPVCPECNGKLHFIQLENHADEIYLSKLSITFSE